MGLVDEPAGERWLLGPDGISVLGKGCGQLRIGIEGPLDAPRDRPTGPAKLDAASERCREPGAEDKREAIRLGHERRHGADGSSDRPANGVGVVLGRGVEGVPGCGQLVSNDGELGSPAGGQVGRGRRICQGLAQGVFSCGQRVAQAAKVLASRLDLLTHRGLINTAPCLSEGDHHGGDAHRRHELPGERPGSDKPLPLPQG